MQSYRIEQQTNEVSKGFGKKGSFPGGGVWHRPKGRARIHTYCWRKAFLSTATHPTTVCVCAVLVLWHMGTTWLGGNPPPRLSASFNIRRINCWQTLPRVDSEDPSPDTHGVTSHTPVHRLPCAAPWVQDSVCKPALLLPNSRPTRPGRRRSL